MKESEFIEMLQRTVKETLSKHLGGDGVVEELARRSALSLAALLSVIEIEERCPVCGLNMPGDMDAQALYLAIIERMKASADARIIRESIPPTSGEAILSVLDELARDSAQTVLAHLFNLQKKTALASATLQAIGGDISSIIGKEGSSHDE